MNLSLGVSNFKKIITENYLYTDKTLFIKEIMDNSADVILITRPRRFGKTLNLSMLYHFLGQNHFTNESENLFAGLNISKETEFCKQHQHQYPVIFVTFKDIKSSSYDKAYDDIAELMGRLYAEHRYLLEGNILHEDEKNAFSDIINEEAKESKIKGALIQLTVYMERKFKKAPILLIDEYDTPMQEAYLHKYYPQMAELMRSIFGQTLKDNDSLGKAIITGITRIAQESLFSGVNNLDIYSLLHEKYGQYFGFSEEEVLKLISDTKQEVSIAAIKEWYNGYQIGKYTLYNPWSIISCLRNDGQLKPYWINTSSNALVGTLLSKAQPEVKKQFEQLLQKQPVEQPIFENLVFLDIETKEGALWSLLLYAGYLKVLSSELQGNRLIAKIAIPNKEVQIVYDNIVEDWFSERVSLAGYDRFIQALAKGDLNEFREYLATYLKQTSSHFDFNRNTHEQIFHIFILGLVVGLRDSYYIYSNQESGLGRFDVICIPLKKQEKGILLEFKTSNKVEDLPKKAQEALEQIKDKQYVEIFKKHNVDSILAIGLAFCGKDVELASTDIQVV